MWENLKEVLEGRVVRLEPLRKRHEEGLFEVARDERIWAWMRYGATHGREEFGLWIDDAIRRSEAGIEGAFATVDVETIASTRAAVSQVSVYQEDDQLVISGTVRQRLRTVVADNGHIDIEVISADGKSVKKFCERYNPRLTRKHRSATFMAHLPITVSEGTTIRLTHHKEPHQG